MMTMTHGPMPIPPLGYLGNPSEKSRELVNSANSLLSLHMISGRSDDAQNRFEAVQIFVACRVFLNSTRTRDGLHLCNVLSSFFWI